MQNLKLAAAFTRARPAAALMVAVLVMVAVTGCGLLPGTAESPDTSATTAAATQTSQVDAAPDFISVGAKVRPAVVAITTETPVSFFGRTFTQEGAGSGWIIDPNGIIVTNNHVVEGASTITVTLDDGGNFRAVRYAPTRWLTSP